MARGTALCVDGIAAPHAQPGLAEIWLAITQSLVDAEPATPDRSRAIAANGPVAVRAAKQAIDVGCEKPMDEGLEVEARCYELVLPTKDRLEALAAFAEKRAPRYVGG